MDPVSNILNVILLCCGVLNLIVNAMVNCYSNLTRILKGLPMLASCFAVFYAILRFVKFF